MRIAVIFVLALLMACTEIAEIYEEFGDHRQDDIHEEHTEILTIGPYTMTCYGPFEQDCLMEYNEEAGGWHFFLRWH